MVELCQAQSALATYLKMVAGSTENNANIHLSLYELGLDMLVQQAMSAC